MSLGANIRRARKARGWTQKELAERVESDASYIYRIETGKANPSIAVLARIAEALEVSARRAGQGEPRRRRGPHPGQRTPRAHAPHRQSRLVSTKTTAGPRAHDRHHAHQEAYARATRYRGTSRAQVGPALTRLPYLTTGRA